MSFRICMNLVVMLFLVSSIICICKKKNNIAIIINVIMALWLLFLWNWSYIFDIIFFLRKLFS